jgi:N-acetylneuraminate synthase
MVMNTRVIAEIGCNHMGDMEVAKELISVAAVYCKADYVKFQKRCNKELLSPEEYSKPHPVPANSYGATYGEHREFLEFDVNQHKTLMKWCKELGIGYSTSVWDVTSAFEMAELNPDFLKVPSACNLNFPLLNALVKGFDGDIHVSTGMTTKDEIEKIVQFFEERNASDRVVLYNCTSGYPVPFEDICLLDINTMKERWGHRVKEIAFSGHHLGIAADIAAVTLGASWVERHFTLDRTWKGTDHSASLEPDGLRRLCRDIKNVSMALTHKETEILSIEQVQRDKLKANSIRPLA